MNESCVNDMRRLEWRDAVLRFINQKAIKSKVGEGFLLVGRVGNCRIDAGFLN